MKSSTAITPGKSGNELGEFRMTKQRQVVYDVLMGDRDHPTATEVFMRSKRRMAGISLATVYNCLEAMTQCGLVNQVNVDREASRYCPNLSPHAHFYCESCGQIADVDLKPGMEAMAPWRLPKGSVVDHVEFAIKGVCSGCAADSETREKVVDES